MLSDRRGDGLGVAEVFGPEVESATATGSAQFATRGSGNPTQNQALFQFIRTQTQISQENLGLVGQVPQIDGATLVLKKIDCCLADGAQVFETMDEPWILAFHTITNAGHQFTGTATPGQAGIDYPTFWCIDRLINGNASKSWRLGRISDKGAQSIGQGQSGINAGGPAMKVIVELIGQQPEFRFLAGTIAIQQESGQRSAKCSGRTETRSHSQGGKYPVIPVGDLQIRTILTDTAQHLDGFFGQCLGQIRKQCLISFVVNVPDPDAIVQRNAQG